MPSLNITHLMLVDGPDFDTCRHRVERFFARTILVKYDSVQVVAEKSLNGADPQFWQKLEQGIAENRALAAELIAELKASDINNIDDMADLPQGYPSKTLHTLAHLLDGFFGVDSRFYNLNDDSHWLNKPQKNKIEQSPDTHWLIYVEASSKTGNADQVSTLRTMPTEKE